jgi:multidrug efflux pump subunit AcrB
MFNLAAKARNYFGAIILTAALLTAGGIYGATRMASGVYPEITFPRIAVVARRAGTDLRNMELQVTVPLEQAVSTVIGVERVRSKTIRGGCDISIDFSPGTDMRRAEQLTWNRIGAARGQMPADVEFTVEQMTPSVFPILSVVLTGGSSPAQLRDYAYYQLAPQIKNIHDVLYCNVAGGDLREIVVEARPDDLLAAELSAADLADQIGKLHRLQPVGRVEQGPFAFQMIVNTQAETAREIEDLVIAVKGNQPLRVRDVADVKVTHQDRVSSVGYEGKDAVVLTVFRRLGGNTVNIANDIRDLLERQKPPGKIQATMAYDQARFIGTALENVRDAILIGGLFSILILLAFLRSWRATLISALAIPVTLAITFLFLHWSGETLNLMSLGGLAVAIGLIIDDTVVVIENIARHLERPLTPGAPFLTPDPSPKEGEGRKTPLTPDSSPTAWTGPTPPPPSPTAWTGPTPPPPSPSLGEGGRGGEGIDPVAAASSEITGAVVGSTLTTVLVFVPLAFIVGVYGQFFAALSWSLSIAVLVSMVISLTLIPVFAARFLAGRPMPQPGPIYRFLARIYEAGLSVALRFPWATLLLSVAAVGFGILLYTGIPSPKVIVARQEAAAGGKPPAPLVKGLETGLLPAMDEGAFVLDYLAPTGTPLERTEEMARTLEQILSENPDVQAYVRRSGTELGLFATKTNRGDIQVILRPAENDPVSLLTKPVRPPFSEVEKELKRDGKEAVRKKYRRRPLPKVMEEIEDEIKEHYSEHQLKFELIQIMEDELNDLSGANRPIEVKLFGPDYTQLRKLAEEVSETLEKSGKGHGLKEVNSNVFAGNPDLLIRVDGARASRLGLTPAEVERQLQVMYLGHVATQVRESALRMTDVRVRYPDVLRFGRGRFDPDMLRNQWLLLPESAASTTTANSSAARLAGLARAVPVSAVATVEPVRSPDEQVRENQQPAIIVTAELAEAEAGLGSVVADIRRNMAEMERKGAIPAGYRWELGGHYIRYQEAVRSFVIVMVVAVFLVFIMLAFQFRSVVLPLLIFLTQPLSLVSGLFALWLTSTPLNVSSMMGMILLVGLDMKNGILLVEYIQQLRQEGMALEPALLLAGRTRFRPILMTSLAAILGLFPLALGIGPGAQMQQPLAIMVIGGLTANMLFTRMVIPVGYLVLERRKQGASATPVASSTPAATAAVASV